jgi:putative transport protein
MSFIVDLLRENPLLLLFLVAAIGYPVGKIRIGGTSLGVAAVLFVGLAFGALDPELALPEVIYLLGLVLFVYTIGLASGSIFFGSLRRKGLHYNLLVASGLIMAAGLTVLARFFFDLSGPITAGMFAGSLTNTPALAGVIENIQAAGGQQALLSAPVIAYSLTYPIGVLGMILSIYLFQRFGKINYAAEARQVPENNLNEPIRSQTICVTKDPGISVAELINKHLWNVVFGRIRHNGQITLVTGQTIIRPGDLVTLVGPEDALEEVTQALGDTSCNEQLEFDISEFDKRRFFVSNPDVTGRQLRELNIIDRFGALVTRLRRGDAEMLPHGETVLAPGDQIRVVAPRSQMDALTRLFGDSYRAVSEIDILTFSLGLALGLLVGLIPIPLTGGVTLRLGLAGGPLLVALLLGALGRTGPLVWTIPYSANLTLRQIGLIFFLAGIGTRSGYAFFSTLIEGTGLVIFAVGAVITTVTGLVTLMVGYKLLKIPMGLMVGILAGLQTQPAVLGFGLEQTKNELPNIGYASVYPVAMIMKILLAQALLIIF